MIVLAEIKKDKPSSVRASQKAPSSAAQKRSNISKISGESLTCVMHGKEMAISNFYKSSQSSVFSGVKYIAICSSCLKKMYLNYYINNGKDYLKALYFTCRRADIIFSMSAAEAALKKAGGDAENLFGWYVGTVNSLPQYTGDVNFDSSDTVEQQGTLEYLAEKRKSSIKLDADDKRNIKDVKKKLGGMNPFEGYEYSDYDLKMMYQDLVGFLEDDDIATDAIKLSIVIQIVNNLHQIRNFDLYISILNNNIKNFSDNLALLTSIQSQKKTVVENNKKLFDSNKWLISDGGSIKSKLAGMMKIYRELDFEPAKVNYFSMLTAEACKSVQDISNQSILEQVRFSETDEQEIFRIQRELIEQRDNEIMQFKEEIKHTAIELVELKKSLKEGV